jgi:lysophospholipase L1-like esterase
MQREQYEWVNLWWEEAADAKTPRVLLIGDSICVGYRPHVQRMLEGFRVDQMATSKALDDPAFFKELRYMLGEYPYRAVHFNNGLHGVHADDADYEQGCRRALEMIRAACSRVAVALSTPVTQVGQTDRADPKMDALVCRRNAIVTGIAAELCMDANDLYTPMLGHPEYRLEDGYHYNEDGRQAQARLVAGCLNALITG